MSKVAKNNVKAEANNTSVDAMLAAAQGQAQEAKSAPVAEGFGENGTKPAGSRAKTTHTTYQRSSSKDEDGNNVQRRNTTVKTRAVAVFFSKKLNQAAVYANLAFATKTKEGSIKVIKQATQKALQDLIKADDLDMELFATDVPVGAELELSKAAAFDKYEAEKFTMLTRRAKVAEAA